MSKGTNERRKPYSETFGSGWEEGLMSDSIEREGHKISWNNGAWWYTFKDQSWVYSQSIEANLIIDGNFPSGTSENTKQGFLWGNLAQSTFAINRETDSLKRTFIYLNMYQIEITQQLLKSNEVSVLYNVTNLSDMDQRIGVSQYADIKSSEPLSVIAGFKGINQSNTNFSFVIMPDTKNMPNWSVGGYSELKGFKQYDVQNATGIGWESGKQYRNTVNATLLSPPVELEENKPMVLGDTGIVMKNPGEMVPSGASVSFSQILKFDLSPPVVELDPVLPVPTIYKDEHFTISGSIKDTDSHQYQLYLELDDLKKTLVPLVNYENIHYNETQHFQVEIEGKYFKGGRNKPTIIGIDETGARSVLKPMEVVIKELDGTPIVQKIKIGGSLKSDLPSLLSSVKGTGVKLKKLVTIDSSKVGFQWAEATLVDVYLKEHIVKIPVNVYDPQTTVLNDFQGFALDVKTIFITKDELAEKVKNGTINQFILENSSASWNMKTGQAISTEFISIPKIDSEYGNHTTSIKVMYNGASLNKDGAVVVTDPLSEGWELGSVADFIESDSYKISWNEGAWWYTHNNTSWIYKKSLNIALIINGMFPDGTTDRTADGFLWLNLQKSYFSINQSDRMLKRTFNYLDVYKIEIIQKLLDNNAVEVTYNVSNLSTEQKKIGISQFADVFVGSDSVPVQPINGFKGINLTHNTSSLAMLPDPATMPNWSAGHYNFVNELKQYSPQNADGVGWETGKQYYTDRGVKLTPPVLLKENKAINLGDSGIGMKNPGVDVAPGENVDFKQTLKYGKLNPPKLDLDQVEGVIYQDETFELTGTISDEDTKNYRLYVELDDLEKTMIPLKEFTDISYGETQKYKEIINGKDLSVGKHTLTIVGINEYGTRSNEKIVNLTISELSGIPKIQKIKVGETISNELTVLFEEVKGIDVKLKSALKQDTSKVGFYWVEATLISNKKEINVNIPVNVYDPVTTVVDDINKMMIDVKDVSILLGEVQIANELNKLDELAINKTKPKSWNMEDGNENTLLLKNNGIKPLFGVYYVTFVATRLDTQKSIQKAAKINVGGELKFKSVPTVLNFETIKLNSNKSYINRSNPDWQLEIENTLGSNWALYVSGTPFKMDNGTIIKESLILKKEGHSNLTIDSNKQKIEIGNQSVPYPVVRWKESEGLLIKMNKGSKAGVYQSQLEWILSNVP